MEHDDEGSGDHDGYGRWADEHAGHEEGTYDGLRHQQEGTSNSIWHVDAWVEDSAVEGKHEEADAQVRGEEARHPRDQR